MAGGDIHGSYKRREHRGRGQTHRARSNNRDAAIRLEIEHPNAMSSDGERLHQAGISGADIVGQRHNTTLRHQHLLGHAAIQGDAVHHRRAQTAQVIITLHTHIAMPTGRNRLQRHRAAVTQGTGDFMADGGGHFKARRDHV